MMIDTGIASLIHVLLAVIWVGGMFFAYWILRPAAGELEPPERLRLWARVLNRFFVWVWLAVVFAPLSGYWLAMRTYGAFEYLPLHVHIMQGVGWLMVLIFLLVYFFPYADLKQAVAREDWPAAGAALPRIRRWVGLNLSLGLLVVAVASGGRYLVVF